MADRIESLSILEAAREVAAIHLRNLEAMAKAQQSLIEGNKLVLQQQLECFQTTIDQMRKTAQGILSDADPASNAGKRFDLIKDWMKQNTYNSSILAELSSKFSGEAGNIIQERVYQGLDETKAVVEKLLGAGGGGATVTEAEAA